MPTTIFYIVIVLLLPAASFAQELTEPYVPVRPIGMGGAFTAVANDENSIWTNPAGVTRIRKNRSRSSLHLLSFPNIIAGFNSSGRDFYDTFKTNRDSGDIQEDVSRIASESELSDKPFWARASVNPFVFFEASRGTPASISLFSNTSTKIVIDEDDTTTARVAAITDVGGTFGTAWSNRTNRLNFGLQFRPTYRYALDDKLPIATLLDKDAIKAEMENSANSGFALAVDIGAMWTFADFWFPTIGFAMRNVPTGCKEEYLNPFDETRHTICGAVYSGSINNPEALSTVDPTDLRVGVSITPRLTRKLALRFAVDGHHIYFSDGTNYYGRPGVSPLKQLHGGVELFVGNPLLLSPFSVRVGVNQGFITSGLSLRLLSLQLAFASYGEDISETDTPREDRRYLGSLTFEF